jgi:drug/metabolite transporter (DMT)-like permease
VPARSHLVVPLLSVLFVPMWASGFLAGKLATARADVPTVLLWRFLIAVAVMGALALATRPALPRGRGWLHLVVVALLLQMGQFTGIYVGFVAGVPAGLSSLVLGMAPLLVGLAGPLLLGERGGPWPVLGLLVGATGAYVVLAGDVRAAPLGPAVAFPVLGMLALAAGTLYQKRFGAETPVVTSVLVQMTACLVLTAAVVAATGTAWLPPAPAWPPVLWLGLVNSALAFAVMFVLLRRVTTTHVSGLLNLVPATVAVAAVPILGEPLTWAAVAGLLIAGAGMFLGQRDGRLMPSRRPRTRRPSSDPHEEEPCPASPP